MSAARCGFGQDRIGLLIARPANADSKRSQKSCDAHGHSCALREWPGTVVQQRSRTQNAFIRNWHQRKFGALPGGGKLSRLEIKLIRPIPLRARINDSRLVNTHGDAKIGVVLRVLVGQLGHLGHGVCRMLFFLGRQSKARREGRWFAVEG